MVNHDTILDRLRLVVAGRARAARDATKEAEVAAQESLAAVYRRRMGRWNLLLEFAGCPWCVGWWVALAGAVGVVAVVGWPWWAVPAVALAASHLIGVAAPLSGDEDIEIVEG